MLDGLTTKRKWMTENLESLPRNPDLEPIASPVPINPDQKPESGLITIVFGLAY